MRADTGKVAIKAVYSKACPTGGLRPALKVLIDRSEVDRRIGEMAREIATDYAGSAPLLIGILNGAAQFMMALLDRLPNEMHRSAQPRAGLLSERRTLPSLNERGCESLKQPMNLGLVAGLVTVDDAVVGDTAMSEASRTFSIQWTLLPSSTP